MFSLLFFVEAPVFFVGSMLGETYIIFSLS